MAKWNELQVKVPLFYPHIHKVMLLTVEALGSFSSHTLCTLSIGWLCFTCMYIVWFVPVLPAKEHCWISALNFFSPVLAKRPWTTHKCLKMPCHISDQAIQKVSYQPSGTSTHRYVQGWHVYQTWHIMLSLYPYYTPFSAGGITEVVLIL